MSKVVDFLERMGADATLRNASVDALARELGNASVEAELAAAILAGDAATLRDRVAPGVFYGVQLDKNKEQEEKRDDQEEKKENTSISHDARRHA